jgi:FkbM family methyltransferase
MFSYYSRRIAHLLLPKPLRRAGSEFFNLYWGWRRAGLREYFVLRRSCGPELRPFHIRTLRFPLYYRPGTSDAEVIVGTVVREEYASPFLPHDPEVIVDAGANIGDMSCWLLSRFANARVVAIEPHPDTFRVLEKNLKPYGDRAVAINAALWPVTCELRLSNEDTPCATTSAPLHGGTAIPGVSLPAILQRFGWERIDLFKCDIEGAEREVFRDPEAWMDRTDTILVETHGDDARNIVVDAATRHGFRHRRYGWLHVFCKTHAHCEPAPGD